MASSVWHTDHYVYLTSKNLLNHDYSHLCISVCRQSAVTMPGLSLDRIKGFSAYQSAHGIMLHTTLHLNKTRPKSRTLMLQGQVTVQPAKLAKLVSGSSEPG